MDPILEIEKQTRLAENRLIEIEVPFKSHLQSLLENQTEKNHLRARYFQELKNLQWKFFEMYVPVLENRGVLTDQIPDFWLTVLKTHNLCSSFVQERDEGLLRHLKNITCMPEEGSFNFNLTFEFSENEFMENQTLTKRYIMASHEEMERAEGTEIKWKQENLTQKVKRMRKRNKRGRVLAKVVDCSSFFNFFKDVTMPAIHDLEALDDSTEDDMREAVEDDFDLAHEFRDEIIPNALFYYLNVRGEEILDQETES